MRMLQDGQVIRETYEVERFLGEGAFAEVYRVKHRFLGRQAMKVFKRVGMGLAEIQEMLSEAILLTHLKHPNIISVSDANVFETRRGTCGYPKSKEAIGLSVIRTASLEATRKSVHYMVRFTTTCNSPRLLKYMNGTSFAKQ